MAHALPNLIPPVDREYTLKFLRGNKNIKNGTEGEWATLKDLLESFFYPMLQAEPFHSKVAQWEQYTDNFPWDTSPLKVVDNLIVGFMKTEKRSNQVSLSLP